MKKLFIQALSTLTIVIVLTVFTVANQNSMPEPATESTGVMPLLNENFEQEVAAVAVTRISII